MVPMRTQSSLGATNFRQMRHYDNKRLLLEASKKYYLDQSFKNCDCGQFRSATYQLEPEQQHISKQPETIQASRYQAFNGLTVALNKSTAVQKKHTESLYSLKSSFHGELRHKLFTTSSDRITKSHLWQS